MSLVNCGGCGRLISNKASSCPSCGEPAPRTGCFGYIMWGGASLAAVLVIFAIISAGGGGGEPSSSLYSTGKSTVRDALKDGDSAKFRNTRTGSNVDGVPALCGEVNAKNGYGAYDGFKRFVSGKRVASIEGDSETFEQLWSMFCQ